MHRKYKYFRSSVQTAKDRRQKFAVTAEIFARLRLLANFRWVNKRTDMHLNLRFVKVIIWFRVQFGIYLHEWVFQKAESARAASASAISVFWKTHKYKLISNWTRKTVWLLINNTNMKKFARKKCQKMFLETIFFALEKTFFKVSVQNFCHCFTWYH